MNKGSEKTEISKISNSPVTKTLPIVIKRKSGNETSPTEPTLQKSGSLSSMNSFGSSPFKTFLENFSPRRRSNQESPKSKHLSGGKEDLSPKTKILSKEKEILNQEELEQKRKISAPPNFFFGQKTDCASPSREFLNVTKEERKNAVTLIDRKEIFNK